MEKAVETVNNGMYISTVAKYGIGNTMKFQTFLRNLAELKEFYSDNSLRIYGIDKFLIGSCNGWRWGEWLYRWGEAILLAIPVNFW